MPKESKDDREEKSGGGDEDGLEQAAHQISKANDVMLASLFIEANSIAEEEAIAPGQELFVEEKSHYEFKEPAPDKYLLEEIYNSLANKEIHHKKLLEEGATTNVFLKFLNKFKSYFNIQVSFKEYAQLTPVEWKQVGIFYKHWKKGISFYMNDFSSQIDLWLRNKEKTKSILQWELLSLLIITIMSLPAFFAASPYAVNANIQVFSKIWTNFIFSFSVISQVLALLPPFFFMSLWFVNVNYLHTSRTFHFFVFATFTVAFIFAALSVFNLGLYWFIDSRFGIQDTPKQ